MTAHSDNLLSRLDGLNEQQLRRDVCAASDGAVQRLVWVEDCELLVCNEVNAGAMAMFAEWPQENGASRLAVYSMRPETLSGQGERA